MNPVVQLQKLGIRFAQILPLKVADKIAAGIGLLFCHLSKTKRSCIENNLLHIFSEQKITPEQLNSYVKATFVNFARTMVDFFRLSYISKDDFDVERVGIENVTRALEHKRGCVLLTLHLGNWDYAGSFLAADGVSVSALVEETESEMFDLYTKHRERTGMRTFSIARAGYAFLDTIKNNRVLAVLADRDIMKNGVTVDFFSGKRQIPKGLAGIIIKKKIPVVFAYLALNPPHKKNRYVAIIEPPLIFDGGVDELNRLMVKKFESFIRRHPDQWFVFHAEWLE